MAFDKQRVSTTGGNCILDSENKVYVNLGQKSVRKKARDINVGDMLLFKKKYITTTLEEVEPHLTKSPRYSLAKEALHEVNTAGQYIPRLRTMTIRGIYTGRVDDSLENKIMKNDGEFTSSEYNSMNNILISTIENHSMDPLKSGFKTWLEGETVAPRDENWRYFRALEDINQGFREWNSNDRSQNSIYFKYKLYTTVRRGIMNYLAQCKGRGKGPNVQEREDSPFNLKLTPEIKATLDFFIKEVNEEYTFVRVTNIDHLHKRRPVNGPKDENDEKLFKGIITEKPDNLDIEEMDLFKLVRHYNDLTEFFGGIMGAMLYSTSEMEEETKNPANLGIMHAYAHEFLSKYKENSGDIKAEQQIYLCSLDKDTRKIFEENKDRLWCQIIDGTMDKIIEMKEGSILNFIETIQSLRNALPRRYIETSFLHKKLMQTAIKYIGDEEGTPQNPIHAATNPYEWKETKEKFERNKKLLNEEYGLIRTEDGNVIGLGDLTQHLGGEGGLENKNEVKEALLTHGLEDFIDCRITRPFFGNEKDNLLKKIRKLLGM
jgi:hypothetical protein